MINRYKCVEMRDYSAMSGGGEVSISSLKVLLYSSLPQKALGGIATWTNIYIQNCVEHDIHCTLVNCAAEGTRAENPEARISFKDEMVRTARIFRDLKRELKTKPDVAHVNTSCGPFGIIRDCIAVKMIKRRDVKVVLHFHCDIPFWVHNAVSRFCLAQLCKDASKILVLCHNSAEYLKNNYSVSSVTVPNFVPEENIVSTRPVNKMCRNVVYVGGVQPDKGCYEIFDVARQCRDLHFCLAGQISEEVDTANIPDNVEMLGSMSHEDIITVLDHADLFLFPSHSEGFSLALAEAMSRGLPVIATDVGANVDMLENKGGLIVPVNNVSSIVSAIEKIKNEKTRSAMSAWNVQKVRENYTARKVLERIKEYYVSVLIEGD